jgi:MinD-like ATPase involved in chromosome partitioning or flagellar assembly
MITFDRVLPEVIRICHEDSATREVIARYCVVRDVRGRVRLIAEPTTSSVSLATLESALVAALGAYFVAPIVSARSKALTEQKLAKHFLDLPNRSWPSGWPASYRNVLGGADTPIDAGTRWTGIERTIGKEAWLTTKPPKPPWPLSSAGAPPIITFHSFKGGVGRTTLVAAYALWLASKAARNRVAIIDLDLEAPGVGTLFSAESERGVLDVLVDHIATGRIDLADASIPSQLAGDLGPKITVFPAGRMSASYVQKLARLDFSSTEPGQDNPVGTALAAMLRAMKGDHDIILLDARAGLHDLAGMSLHGLAHVDVLVFRSTTQNLAGLEQTLRTLGSREDDPELVLVETLLPVKDDEFEARRQRTRARVYELLCEHVYADSDPPQLGDVGVAHDVVSVRRKELLDGLDSLEGRVDDVLRDPELQAVARRIDDASARDDENDA